MNTQFDPEPTQTWQRKNFDDAPFRKLDYQQSDADRRRGSEIETNRDLVKPVEQLVCDVHEETHDPRRTPEQNIAGAQKRLVSLMARVAKSNDRLSRLMMWMTVAITVMTAVILVLTFLMWSQSRSNSSLATQAPASQAAP